MNRDDMMRRLTVGIGKVGELDERSIVTHVGIPMPIEMPGQSQFRYDPANRFVAFDVDNGPTNIEVRIPFELVELLAASVAGLRKPGEADMPKL